MVPNLGLKWAKSDDSPLFVGLTLQNGSDYEAYSSDFKRFNVDDLATSCKNLLSVGPVTPEVKRG